MSLSEDLNNVHTLSDLLNYTKTKTIEEIKVGTLAYFDSISQAYDNIKKYSIVKVKPFPLAENQSEYTLYCYNLFKDATLSKNDIVMVLFMDLNFIKNLSSNAFKPMTTTSSKYHQQKYAIVVPTAGMGGGSGGGTHGVPADFIVEQGATDIWVWRKWNSGLAECWGRTYYWINPSTSGWSSWGSIYTWTAIGSNINYPFSFVDRPQEHVEYTYCDLSYGAWLIRTGNNSSTATGKYDIARPTNPGGTSMTIYLDIYVAGYYK